VVHTITYEPRSPAMAEDPAKHFDQVVLTYTALSAAHITFISSSVL
jgi:hypothetical protein